MTFPRFARIHLIRLWVAAASSPGTFRPYRLRYFNSWNRKVGTEASCQNRIKTSQSLLAHYLRIQLGQSNNVSAPLAWLIEDEILCSGCSNIKKSQMTIQMRSARVTNFGSQSQNIIFRQVNHIKCISFNSHVYKLFKAARDSKILDYTL